MSSKPKGFTLIEMSVVLVIIGLLISGILITKSMISSTKVSSTVAQIGQFDAAVLNFKTQYNSLPGDTTLLAPAGNGNGYINATSTSTQGWGIEGERANFWYHLSVSGFMSTSNERYSNDFSSGIKHSGSGQNVPESKIARNASVLALSQSYSGLNGYYTNAYFFSDCSLTTTILVDECKGAIDMVDALAIDSKIDDGYSVSGMVLATDDGGDEVSNYSEFPPISNDNIGVLYSNITSKANLLVSIGTQTQDNPKTLISIDGD